MDKNVLQVKTLTADELLELDSEFAFLLTKPTEARAIFTALHDYFSKVNFSAAEIQKHYASYWKWYVQASWLRLNELDFDVFKAVCTYQLPMAFQLGKSVYNDFVFYFHTHFVEPEEMNVVYEEIRKAILDSTALLNPWSPQSITVEEASIYFNGIYGLENNEADLEDAVVSVGINLFPPEHSVRDVTDDERRDSAFGFLVMLYALARPVKAIDMVDEYLDYLDYYGDEIKTPYFVPEPINAPVRTVLTKPTYQQIKAEIEDLYEVDDAGNFVDLKRVLRRLARMAERYHDHNIMALYYYNQKEGSFQWNQLMLGNKKV